MNGKDLGERERENAASSQKAHVSLVYRLFYVDRGKSASPGEALRRPICLKDTCAGVRPFQSAQGSWYGR
jgi:hypothetical protein